MGSIEEQEGVYRIGASKMMLGAHRTLPDAVPPAPIDLNGSNSFEAGFPLYGWVMGVFPAPNKEDRYLVQFVGKRLLRILAYADRYGRVFSTDRPLEAPPARSPEMEFLRSSTQVASMEEQGFVEVRGEEGPARQAGRYRRKHGRYSLFDSWYDFGPYGSDLSYDDALARAYLAFSYRPRIGGARVPSRGVGVVRDRLRDGKLLPALEAIMADIRSAEADPVLNPPALLCVLAHWLEEAGLGSIVARKVPVGALRLVRTMQYAGTYYVSLEEAGAPVSRREIWALEAALNRYLLLNEAFGDQASLATEADCSRWDEYLTETVGVQELSSACAEGVPAGTPNGEWELRCGISAAIERLRLPFRIDVDLQVNALEGVVALDLTVPDAALMASWRWGEAPAGAGASEERVTISWEEREACSRRYAMHLCLALVAAAFDASDTVQRVDVVARPFEDERTSTDDVSDDDREFPVDEGLPAYLQVTFLRALFADAPRFSAALTGDPLPLLVEAGAVFEVPAADPFAVVNAFPAARMRSLVPESIDEPLPLAAQTVLGAERARDVRIDFSAYRRKIGEGIADRVARASSTTEAIRIVREEQAAAEGRDDDRTAMAATRLMAALAEGSLDTEDQNAVVSRFLGEDRCLTALGRARGYARQDPEKAATILTDAIDEAAALDGYVDGASTVYRSFDSYVSRVLYNRARAEASGEERSAVGNLFSSPVGILLPGEAAAADVGKRLELVPASFYLCHLEVVRLLEHSFERADEALRYGRNALRVGPTTPAGYRQLGRAYMLVGDMDNAISVLRAGLHVALQPGDIAVAYYQLAYALWKTGESHLGAACYLKSIMTSPVVSLQATAELRELIDEHGVDPIKHEDVDGMLSGAGIALAPVDEAMSVLEEGSVVAVDAGLFPVAHNLLSLRLHYRPDDALMSVLRSLDD